MWTLIDAYFNPAMRDKATPLYVGFRVQGFYYYAQKVKGYLPGYYG